MALLEIKNLTKEYKESEGVLNNISLSVEKGEVLVILGPSGCGKSTLLRCINGLERIQSGEIYLDGKLISNQTKEMHKVREKIGMVFQSYDLFPNMTVLKNILLGPLKVQKRNVREATEQAENLLSRIGLLDKKNSYPAELSGGQKQRVAIARALCMNPDVLLFDEVTASLDPEMVREVLQVIRELSHTGITMVIVTHEMRFAREVSTGIIFMDNGLIIENDKPEIIFNSPKNSRVTEFFHKLI